MAVNVSFSALVYLQSFGVIRVPIFPTAFLENQPLGARRPSEDGYGSGDSREPSAECR